MAIITYRGAVDVVEIAETGQYAYRDKPLEVPDDVAERLALAEDWHGADEDDDELTREELYAHAQLLDIPGRSSMDKDELAAAIAEHEEGE